MPIIDMPPSQLKEYQGVNSRPKDFDEFWHASLEELYAIDHKPTFEPYDFPSSVAEAYKLTLTSTKGSYEGMRYYLRHFDPRHEHIDEFFEKLGYIDLQFLAPRIKSKV